MVEVRFHLEARSELLAAADWYFVRSPAAARKFREAFASLLSLIRDRPDSFPFYDQPFRFGKLHPYPYLIVFRAQSGAIDVMAVAHSRRRFGYWRDRRPESS